MAYVSRLSDYVRGGVLTANIREGRPVKLVDGAGAKGELPGIALATAGETKNVFCLMTPPDDFPRPVPAGLYTAGPVLTFLNNNAGYANPVRSDTFYHVGKSNLEDPTLNTGELGQVHRGGTYAVPAGVFTDVAGIRVPGARIAVGAGSLWALAADDTTAVGFVEEYRATDGYLVFTLYQ